MTAQPTAVTSALLSGERGRQSALAALRTAINSGELPPASRLVEQELAERYGVTRSSIRAALFDLSAEGLVERVPNRGSRVRVVTIDEAVAIIEVRTKLESLCAAKAAGRLTDAEAQQLRAVGEEMKEAVAQEDSSRYTNLNTRLHALVRDLGHQPIAVELLGRLNGQLVRHRFRLSQRDSRRQQSLGEHLEIIEAICARDAERAERAVHVHLASVITALRATPEGML